jgi:hypothetical protein
MGIAITWVQLQQINQREVEMKKLMKHTETIVKRNLVNFLTLTFMLVLLVPSAYASHSPNELRVSPNNMIAQDKTNKTEPFLISPVKDIPGGSGGGTKRWPGIYRMFGEDETNETEPFLISPSEGDGKPGGSGGGKGGSFWIYRIFGEDETNETEPFMISPRIRKPGSSGGEGKFWPGIYRIFGSNDTNDHLMAGKTPRPGKFSPTDRGSGKSIPVLPTPPALPTPPSSG